MRSKVIEAMTISDVMRKVERLAAKLSFIASMAIYSLLVIYHWFPDFLNQALRFSFFETVILSIAFAILNRLLVLEEKFGQEILRDELKIFQKREDAYIYTCDILHNRHINKVDLLQFTGFTSIHLLKQIAKNSPNVIVRLLLIDPEKSKFYDADRPEHHISRIKGTLSQLDVLKSDYPSITVGVWFYNTEPGISGIIIDSWMVAAGWYHVFLTDSHSNIITIKGHATPAIIAVDKEAEPLLWMVQKQFETVFKSAKFGFAFGPKSQSLLET